MEWSQKKFCGPGTYPKCVFCKKPDSDWSTLASGRLFIKFRSIQGVPTLHSVSSPRYQRETECSNALPIGHQCISVTLLQQQWRNVTVMYHWPMCISGQCNVSVLLWPNVSVQQCSGSGQQPIWPGSAPFFTQGCLAIPL